MAAEASVREQRRPGLRRNALGMIGIGVIGMAMMSPAIGFYGNWGYVHTSAGGASAFLFLIGGLIIAPTAVSYALVSRKLSSAGSAYTWAGHAISRHVGNWLGFIMIPFYCLVVCGPAILFGLFFNAFLHDVGLDVPLTQYWTFALGVVVMLLVTGGIAFSGITPSARVSLVMVVFETLVVLALGITIFVEKIHHLSGMPFDPSVQGFTQNAFWLAMPIAVFSYIGFDVISLTAEEAKVAKRSVPTATLAGVAFLGLFAVAMADSFSFSGSEKQIGGWVSSAITPVIPPASYAPGSRASTKAPTRPSSPTAPANR
jgi:putrescine importer